MIPTQSMISRQQRPGVRRLPPKNKRAATLIAFLLIPLSGLITDIYIPSMPHMALELHQPEAAVQLTLSLFLVSYGLAQFVTGSLIDSYGRFRLTLVSLAVFIVSNIVIIFTKQIEWIYAMRIVQGITTGFIVVAKRAFFVDVYEGEERRHYLSLMSIVWSSAPVIAPFIGGYLQQYFNWQANFCVLAVYGLLMLVLEWTFSGETVPVYRNFNWKALLQDYRFMMRSRVFAYGLLICGLCYGTTMIFGLAGAFIIEHKMHYSSVVAGYGALVMGVAWMCGGFLGKASLNKAFLPKLRRSNAAQLLATLLMIVTAVWVYNLYTLLFFAFLIHVCVGFIFNNYFAYCLGRFPQMAGLASGLSGGANFIVTAVTSYTVVGILRPQSQPVLGYGYLIMGGIAFLVLQLLLKKEPEQV
ncbi:MFS transporter [Niabella drilacis]|uniref:Drug resistance transporter, Bcr/CflA subfamily n=1 Tax=Niabella drilacis (strain DSM 25811 / CCM 8410 / CCUG 62505 / LMG 26954 / E90) TaxID=1285928 RepID=A0A1G6NNN4_NIADE|nr:MFS transporter [Niabella drilacis]SDC68984.1 drug resistance transporter, Bcr/CflA subfamily [Niabella drilacis]